jgi:hypothetical protein
MQLSKAFAVRGALRGPRIARLRIGEGRLWRNADLEIRGPGRGIVEDQHDSQSRVQISPLADSVEMTREGADSVEMTWWGWSSRSVEFLPDVSPKRRRGGVLSRNSTAFQGSRDADWKEFQRKT